MGPTGTEPMSELMRFNRKTCKVTVKKFGLSRRLDLNDVSVGQELKVTGSVAPFSGAAQGVKTVLAVLA